jgi:dihydropteroate synthase
MADTADVEIETEVVEASTTTGPVAEAIAPRERPRVLGILNVTPDSFSDGGRWNEPDDAIAHAVELHEAGADIIDVGGESTRPGADRVGEDEEHERVLPIVAALVERGVTVSVDTMRASTAALAAEAGASIINDVSAGQADPEMFRFIAASEVDYAATHWRGMSHETGGFTNVVEEVRDDLKYRIAELIIWGADPARIIVDPGIGFGKTEDENWALLGHLDALVTLEHRVLVGVSRKRFLSRFTADDAPAADRDPATATISALAAQAGAWGVRVHDVAGTRSTLEVWEAWEQGSTS